MTADVAAVEQALLALSPHDRAAVVQRALLSLDDSEFDSAYQADVDAAWRAEFRRRIDSIESGKATLVSGEESAARVRALLSELHQ